VVVQPPNSQPYRSRYDRLLLPWETVNGDHVISSLSFNTAPALAA
jgi:hypothetical protein